MTKKYVDMTPEEQGEFSREQWHYAIDRIPDLIEEIRQGNRLPDYEMQELHALLGFAQVNILNMLLGKLPDLTVLGVPLSDLLGGAPPEPEEHMH